MIFIEEKTTGYGIKIDTRLSFLYEIALARFIILQIDRPTKKSTVINRFSIDFKGLNISNGTFGNEKEPATLDLLNSVINRLNSISNGLVSGMIDHDYMSFLLQDYLNIKICITDLDFCKIDAINFDIHIEE